MRRLLLALAALTLVVLLLPFGRREAPPREPNKRPNDWFWFQRADAAGDIPQAALARALDQAAAKEREGALLAGRAGWEPAGPTNIGARVTDIAVHPTNADLAYAAMASGGIFKTVDGGAHWAPIFDEQAVLPVGAVALDPSNPNVIYAGTGEANAASLSFFGLGVFKSTDAGASWQQLGLEATRYIGRILVDPTNGQRVYVAASGKLFGTNPERGVYRSLNGGGSWQRVFALTDSTACIDLALNPQNPQVLYAAMWERVRGLTYRRSGGPSSGLWRSTNGGDSWQELTSGLPTDSNVGRIGIAVCAGQPSVLYAIYADASAYFRGVYKSTNGGDSWTQVNDGALSGIYASYGWWFGNIRVDPANANNVIALGLYAYP
ncbi:glycosyl hydrolase, partial [bacterium]|nr:glycosyl hydrolase [bacterium]